MPMRVSGTVEATAHSDGDSGDCSSCQAALSNPHSCSVPGGPAYRFAFVMDQQVGLRTHAMNVQNAVCGDCSIRSTWVPVTYDLARGWQKQLPGIPASLRGSLMGAAEIRRGLQGKPDLDAILWATWAAKCVPELVRRVTSFLVMDMTPTQMENMGELYGYTRARARFMGGWKRRATERLYRQAVHLFPWSNWVADSLRGDYGVPAHKITPISPGVDTSLYQPDFSKRGNDGVVRVLFVGGDFARKGGELLLRWARNTRIRTPWELHLVTRDQVPPQAGIFVHRNLSNNSPELIDLYQRCDLFVLPTLADCYSLVSLEAMASGLPVIVSRLGGIPEILDEGNTGYLIEPGDYSALALHLDQLVRDASLRRVMGTAARRRVCEHFDARTNVDRILTTMKSAVRRHECQPELRQIAESYGTAR